MVCCPNWGTTNSVCKSALGKLNLRSVVLAVQGAADRWCCWLLSLLWAGASNYFAGPHWTLPPDLKRRQERANLMHQGLVRCRAMGPTQGQMKIRESVSAASTLRHSTPLQCA